MTPPWACIPIDILGDFGCVCIEETPSCSKAELKLENNTPKTMKKGTKKNRFKIVKF